MGPGFRVCSLSGEVVGRFSAGAAKWVRFFARALIFSGLVALLASWPSPSCEIASLLVAICCGGFGGFVAFPPVWLGGAVLTPGVAAVELSSNRCPVFSKSRGRCPSSLVDTGILSLLFGWKLRVRVCVRSSLDLVLLGEEVVRASAVVVPGSWRRFEIFGIFCCDP